MKLKRSNIFLKEFNKLLRQWVKERESLQKSSSDQTIISCIVICLAIHEVHVHSWLSNIKLSVENYDDDTADNVGFLALAA